MTYLERWKQEHPGCRSEDVLRTVRLECPCDGSGHEISCPGGIFGLPFADRCSNCWNREIPGTENKPNNEREETNMNNKKFTKKDLKPGYIVKMRDGSLNMIMLDTKDKMVSVDNNKGWMNITDSYSNDLLHGRGLSLNPSKYDIVEVYGRNYSASELLTFTLTGRELLWKREPEKTCYQCAHKVVCTHVGMCEHFMAKAE